MTPAQPNAKCLCVPEANTLLTGIITWHAQRLHCGVQLVVYVCVCTCMRASTANPHAANPGSPQSKSVVITKNCSNQDISYQSLREMGLFILQLPIFN